MLGKLIKHEFKAVSKILGILHIALLITTIMGIFAINLSKNNTFEYINKVTLVLYILILMAVAVAVLIYFIVRFYRNLFTDEGYLMNTLPVKSYELILSKLIVSIIWTLINAVCTAFSSLILIVSQISLSDLYKGLNQIVSELTRETGIEMISFFSLIVIGGLISIFYMLLMFYTSIALGQTMRNHKILFSMGAYVVLYVFSQIISVLGLLPFGFTAILEPDNFDYNTIFTPVMLLSYFVSIFLAIVYFAITNYVLHKKLNLE